MGDNVFGMDIRRFSVLFIAIIIILSLLASFANIKVPQNTSTIQIGSGGGSEGSYSVQGPSYIYNKTITLAPDIQDFAYVKGNYSNLPAPYYNISPDIYILFNFSEPSNNLLNLLLNALSWNASEIAPGPYGALLSSASSAYVNITGYKNASLQPFSLNVNDTENYSKWELIVKYGETFEAPNGFQPDWSYPPSDLISVNSPTYKIINSYTLKTIVNITYHLGNLQLIRTGQRTGTGTYYDPCTGSERSYTYRDYCYYYARDINYSIQVYLDQNGSISQIANLTGTKEIYWNQQGTLGGIYQGSAIVPPGVLKQYNATAEIRYYPGSSSTNYYSNFQCKKGNVTYGFNIYEGSRISYYPQFSENIKQYTFNWYEYSVIFPINILVFNGTNPQTSINNEVYDSRNITTDFSYNIWSSDPQVNSNRIVTYDHIQIANYTIQRTWNAGNIEIVPQPDTQLTTQPNLDIINYYLTFNVQDNTVQSPPWIFQKMTFNRYAALSWFYLEQNATLAHALYSYIMNTINKSDLQFWKFEYFVLASQFVMNTYNTTYSVFNNMLELESFYENWSLVNANILNLSAWPNLEYFNNLLMFFNVSKIPPIYNNTIFYNISGNYEIYLVDVYNALGYSQFNKVPFGNEYYFNPTDNKTIYFYLNMTKQPIPYVGQTLYFTSANYVPVIFYATFQYPPEASVKITTIWNGTAWVT